MHIKSNSLKSFFLSLMYSGSMPTNYERYYGFTRFAIELNELDPLLKDLLPATDARFRPDQRQECLLIPLIFGGFKAGLG